MNTPLWIFAIYIVGFIGTCFAAGLTTRGGDDTVYEMDYWALAMFWPIVVCMAVLFLAMWLPYKLGRQIKSGTPTSKGEPR